MKLIDKINQLIEVQITNGKSILDPNYVEVVVSGRVKHQQYDRDGPPRLTMPGASFPVDAEITEYPYVSDRYTLEQHNAEVTPPRQYGHHHWSVKSPNGAVLNIAPCDAGPLADFLECDYDWVQYKNSPGD